MSVQAADVRPGKCFLSEGAKPQVVRVLSIREGVVRFEARAKRRAAWALRGEAAVPEFLAGLVREVGSDFEPVGEPRLHL